MHGDLSIHRDRSDSEQYVQGVGQHGVGESKPLPGGTIPIAVEGDGGKMRIIDV